MKRFGVCFLLLGIYIMCLSGCQISQKKGWLHCLYVPTMIQKIDDTYFIVDCWQHRVLYNQSLDSDISKWNTLTDEEYIGGHTVASDGEVYLLDNTDSNEVIVYVKSDEGYEKLQTIKGIQGRPHYILYDENEDRFLVIGSMIGKIYVFENTHEGYVDWIDTITLPEIESSYVRSISIIDNQLYTVSSSGKICVYNIKNKGFELTAVYDVPEEYYGMNYITKIDGMFYVTVNTDSSGDVAAATIFRVKDLQDISTGQVEDIYDQFDFDTQPYFITFFEGRYFISEISAEGDNGIVSCRIEDNKISDINWLFRFSEAKNESKERYAEKYKESKEIVDVFLFAGQSNMAGHGDALEAPEVIMGYEYRAVSSPGELFPICEPFGINENREQGINDTFENMTVLRKTGSLVSSFANSYYEKTGVPIVGISCSEGATGIDEWLPGTERYADLVQRCQLCLQYLDDSGVYQVRNIYCVWCQGESDGDMGMPPEEYARKLTELSETLVGEGIDKVMVIRIGNYAEDAKKYDNIISAQTKICQENDNCVLISTRFAEMAATGLMKDSYHYTQNGYNLVGEEAGKNAGYYSDTGLEPNLYDYEYQREYEGH